VGRISARPLTRSFSIRTSPRRTSVRLTPKTLSTPRSSSILQAHTSRGIPFQTVIEGFHRAQQETEASLGLRSQLIMCFLRDLTVDSAMDTLEQSLAYKDWIVGSTSGSASTKSGWRESTTASTRSRTRR
jgi:hypothetical protein